MLIIQKFVLSVFRMNKLIASILLYENQILIGNSWPFKYCIHYTNIELRTCMKSAYKFLDDKK